MPRVLVTLTVMAALAAATGRAAGVCDPTFAGRVDRGLLEEDEITEASGLPSSHRNPGVFWTHNDSGDLNRVFALDDHGGHLGTYTIAGTTNRDWEDIATGPGPDPGRSYLFIGEIGDNNAVHETIHGLFANRHRAPAALSRTRENPGSPRNAPNRLRQATYDKAPKALPLRALR